MFEMPCLMGKYRQQFPMGILGQKVIGDADGTEKRKLQHKGIFGCALGRFVIHFDPPHLFPASFQQLQNILFQLSFLKFLPLLLFIYPFFMVYPYYKISKITYAEAILGDLWQDKLKATIKRWRRYSL